MNVLFVISGKSYYGISPITLNQGKSLIKEGVNVEYFTITKKGLIGYLSSIPILKKKLKKKQYSIVHAHYSLSAFAATFAGAKPLVVSLMGSDVKARAYYKTIIKFLNKHFWSAAIVKSKDMKNSLGIENVKIIPNGVDFEKFKPYSKKEAFEITKWDQSKKHILFGADPKREEKNFNLAKKAFEKLPHDNIELHSLNKVSNDEMPFYYNASDVLLLTSFWEGSPNVIKEAMACNRPIVSTNVGDVKEVISNTKGCFVSSFNPPDVSNKLNKALEYKFTNGRTKIAHLDNLAIAKEIISVYKSVLKH